MATRIRAGLLGNALARTRASTQESLHTPEACCAQDLGWRGSHSKGPRCPVQQGGFRTITLGRILKKQASCLSSPPLHPAAQTEQTVTHATASVSSLKQRGRWVATSQLGGETPMKGTPRAAARAGLRMPNCHISRAFKGYAEDTITSNQVSHSEQHS